MPKVRKFISIEMIRDGGSFALKFESCDGCQYILFTKVRFSDLGPAKKDQHGDHEEKELVGYYEPVIIDCEPAKRPQDTEKVRYSELCGPESLVSWHQACEIIAEVGDLVPGLSPIQADWLNQMTAVVQGAGNPPPGSKKRSLWTRASRKDSGLG